VTREFHVYTTDLSAEGTYAITVFSNTDIVTTPVQDTFYVYVATPSSTEASTESSTEATT